MPKRNAKEIRCIVALTGLGLISMVLTVLIVNCLRYFWFRMSPVTAEDYLGATLALVIAILFLGFIALMIIAVFVLLIDRWVEKDDTKN